MINRFVTTLAQRQMTDNKHPSHDNSRTLQYKLQHSAKTNSCQVKWNKTVSKQLKSNAASAFHFFIKFVTQTNSFIRR